MAFNPLPNQWIASWTTAATTTTANQSVVFPLTSVPEMSSTEASATTGDIRKCWFALNEKMFQEYNTKQAVGDAPNKMSLFKSVSVNTSTGVSTVTYTSSFQTTVPAGQQEVVTPD